MKELQQLVQEFCTQHNLNAPIELRFIDLVSELGEVGKELLKGSSYGSSPLNLPNTFGEELGDTLFSLIVLANQADIDLELVLKGVMSKYKTRITENNHPGSS